MIPWVTVLAYSDPRGLPIAIAVSPTFSLLESPNSATVVTFSEEIFTTAISENVSEPTISPGTFVPSAKRISTFCHKVGIFPILFVNNTRTFTCYLLRVGIRICLVISKNTILPIC